MPPDHPQDAPPEAPAKPPSPTQTATAPLSLPSSLSLAIIRRRLTFIMLVRAIVFTLILGGTVSVYLFSGNPEQLGGPYITFFFIFIAGLYLLNIFYAVMLRRGRNLTLLALFQVGSDLLVSAVLVNFTGGADSAFVLLFLLSPIAAAVTLSRRAAVLTAVTGTALLALVVWLGFARLLPTLPGQLRLPWEVTVGSIWGSLLINGGAMFAVAFLAGYLAEQLRAAAETMEVQQAHIFNLAALNADIIRCLTSGLITVSREGRVLTLNQTAAQILGTSDARSVEKTLQQLSPELARRVDGSEGVSRSELTLERDGAPLLLDVAVSRLTDHRNELMGRIINFQDITEQRRLEQQMRRAEHLASLGRVAAGIAHEIRNPLGSISGSLQMLRTGQSMEPDDIKLVDIALREIDRMDKLIADLLKYARPRPLQPRRLDLSQELQQMVGSIAGLKGSEAVPPVEIEQDQGSDRRGLWVDADRDQLEGLLWNLVLNAWQSGEDVRVSIRLGLAGPDQVALEVVDDGPGIPDELQTRIYEPFFTTKDQGTGLGLSAVHRIVQEHGGMIEVQSAAGQGTTFRILLPRAAAPAPTAD